jgi:hypothetical protein
MQAYMAYVEPWLELESLKRKSVMHAPPHDTMLHMLICSAAAARVLQIDAFHGKWQYLFIETICNDDSILEQNYLHKLSYSPDYQNCSSEEVRGAGSSAGGLVAHSWMHAWRMLHGRMAQGRMLQHHADGTLQSICCSCSARCCIRWTARATPVLCSQAFAQLRCTCQHACGPCCCLGSHRLLATCWLPAGMSTDACHCPPARPFMTSRSASGSTSRCTSPSPTGTSTTSS